MDNDKIINIIKKIDNLKDNERELFYKVDSMYSLLKDDDRSSAKGLISKVNELDQTVEKLETANRNLKIISKAIMAVAGGFVTFIVEHFFIFKH